MSTTDDTNAALRGSGSNDLLCPLPEPALTHDRHGHMLLIGPCYTEDQMRAYAAQEVAAERERWRELLEARAAGCERAAENTEDPKFDAMARVLMSVREDGSKA